MFGKKKKVKEEKKDVLPEKTEVIDASIKSADSSDVVQPPIPPQSQATNDQKPEQLTEEDKALLEVIRAFRKYDGVYTASDLANMSHPVIEAERSNALFAIYAELKGLREDISKLS